MIYTLEDLQEMRKGAYVRGLIHGVVSVVAIIVVLITLWLACFI